MLVLTRKIGESIRIGDDIKITVVEVDGNSVKFGIEAPRSVAVHREEIYQKILEENKQAATQHSEDSMAQIASLFRKKQ